MDDSDEEELTLDQADDMEDVQVELDLVDLEEKDYHSTKQFLLNYLDGKVFLTTDLADLIVTRKEIGTSIRVNGTDDSYGFVSVLNMHHHAGVKAILEIRNHMLQKCADKATRDVLVSLFTDSSKGLGLLLNERMVNIPDALAPPLHQNLFDEIAIAFNTEKAAAAPGTQLYWDIENYIFITTIYLESLPTRVPTGKRNKQQNEESLYRYQKAEDEIYLKHASVRCEWAGRKVPHAMTGVSLTEMRVLAVVNRSKIPVILKELAETYPPPDSATVLSDGLVG